MRNEISIVPLSSLKILLVRRCEQNCPKKTIPNHPKSNKKKEQNKPKLTMGFLQKFTIGYTLPNKPANCPSDTKSCWGGTFRRSTPALDAGFPGLGGPAQKPVFDRNWALEQGKMVISMMISWFFKVFSWWFGDFNDDFMVKSILVKSNGIYWDMRHHYMDLTVV